MSYVFLGVFVSWWLISASLNSAFRTPHSQFERFPHQVRQVRQVRWTTHLPHAKLLSLWRPITPAHERRRDGTRIQLVRFASRHVRALTGLGWRAATSAPCPCEGMGRAQSGHQDSTPRADLNFPVNHRVMRSLFRPASPHRPGGDHRSAMFIPNAGPNPGESGKIRPNPRFRTRNQKLKTRNQLRAFERKRAVMRAFERF
jgi:hypothetical protein